jgi:hypothetical protein
MKKNVTRLKKKHTHLTFIIFTSFFFLLLAFT